MAQGKRRQVKILFLHGINAKPSIKWLDAVNQALELLSTPPIPARAVVAPDYSDLLSAKTVEPPEFPVAPRSIRNDEQARLSYLQRQADLGRRLASVGLTSPSVGKNTGRYPKPPKPVVKSALKLGLLKQAEEFRRDAARRAAIRERALAAADPRYDWIVIGHSLGTLVALDLVQHLDEQIHIPLLITVASPLGHFHDEKTLFDGTLDYQQVGGWLNLYNVNDPVPSGKGLSYVYADVLDLPISLPARVHAAGPCLSRPAVAAEIQRARRGAPKAPSRRSPRSMEWDLSSLHAAAGLQVSYHTLELLKARKAQNASRYATARMLTIGQFEDALLTQERQAAASANPVTRNRRAVYLSFPDPRNSLAPFIKDKVDSSDYATLLTSLVTNNPITPFDIDVPSAVRDEARRQTAFDLGMPDSHADIARKEYDEARESFVTRSEKAGRALKGLPAPVVPIMIGAGLVAVIAAPALILAAAPAGLTGAAAMTAGLAALGPGGMMGGLAVVGTVGAIGGATASAGAMAALGRAVAAGSPAEVRQWCIELMTRAAIDKKIGSTSEPGLQEREALESAASSVNATITRLEAVSDSSGPTLKGERTKASHLRHAIRWLDKKGIGSVPDSQDEEVVLDEGTLKGSK